MAALQGVQLGDYHTLKDWGLYIVVGGTTVGPAEPDQSLLIKVPFSDRILDLSKSLDGKVHYTQRKITITLKCVKPKSFGPASRAPSKTLCRDSGCAASLMMTRRGTGRATGQ